MSVNALLKVVGDPIPVISCSYGFNQTVSRYSGGKPDSRVSSMDIHVLIAGDKSTELLEWMTDPHSYKDGSIQFINIASDATLKELKFTNGRVVSYQESHTADGGQGHIIAISITADTISVGEIQHLNDWEF